MTARNARAMVGGDFFKQSVAGDELANACDSFSDVQPDNELSRLKEFTEQ
jgi:hypothetical protein